VAPEKIIELVDSKLAVGGVGEFAAASPHSNQRLSSYFSQSRKKEKPPTLL
jgi:hypothetical protein